MTRCISPRNVIGAMVSTAAAISLPRGPWSAIDSIDTPAVLANDADNTSGSDCGSRPSRKIETVGRMARNLASAFPRASAIVAPSVMRRSLSSIASDSYNPE